MCNRARMMRTAMALLLLLAGACAQHDDAEPSVASSALALPTPAVSTPTSSPAEISVRAKIARESVDQLDSASARAYRQAEKVALSEALAIKRAALSQTENRRPSQASAERDLFDGKLATLRASIADDEQKLQRLNSQKE